MSRERLLAEVWGYHFDPGSNVVDVCVRRLRKKLGADAPIETVRHAGYRARCGLGRSSSRGSRSRVGERRARWCRWQSWETIPFHFIWVSLTLLYGFRVWAARPTLRRRSRSWRRRPAS